MSAEEFIFCSDMLQNITDNQRPDNIKNSLLQLQEKYGMQ